SRPCSGSHCTHTSSHFCCSAPARLDRASAFIVESLSLHRFQQGVNHGTRMPSYRQGPNGGQQRLARQQQDEASFPSQSAIAPFLGRKRKPLDSPSRIHSRTAYH